MFCEVVHELIYEPIHEIIYDHFKNYGIQYPEQDMGFNISTRHDTKPKK